MPKKNRAARFLSADNALRLLASPPRPSPPIFSLLFSSLSPSFLQLAFLPHSPPVLHPFLVLLTSPLLPFFIPLPSHHIHLFPNHCSTIRGGRQGHQSLRISCAQIGEGLVQPGTQCTPSSTSASTSSGPGQGWEEGEQAERGWGSSEAVRISSTYYRV